MSDREVAGKPCCGRSDSSVDALRHTTIIATGSTRCHSRRQAQPHLDIKCAALLVLAACDERHPGTVGRPLRWHKRLAATRMGVDIKRAVVGCRQAGIKVQCLSMRAKGSNLSTTPPGLPHPSSGSATASRPDTPVGGISGPKSAGSAGNSIVKLPVC